MFAKAVYAMMKTKIAEGDGNYFEIGVFDGDGTAEIAKTFSDRTVYCIDPFIEDGNTGHTSLVTKGEAMPIQRTTALDHFAQHDNIKFYETTSQDFLKNLTDEKVQEFNISYVFIDGDHSAEAAWHDCGLAMKLIGKKSGLVVLDDMHLDGPLEAVYLFRKTYANRIKRDFLSGSSSYFEIEAE